MRIAKFVAVAAVALSVTAMAGCTAEEPGSVIAPVTMEANDLQGETVELVVGQVLNINTGSMAVDSYTGEVDDTTVAEFTAGYEQDGASFNPGVTALAVGESGVTMINDNGGIQPLEFTVVVSERE